MPHKALMKAMGLLKKHAHVHIPIKILYIISAASNSKQKFQQEVLHWLVEAFQEVGEKVEENLGSSQLPLKSYYSKSCLHHKNMPLPLHFMYY